MKNLLKKAISEYKKINDSAHENQKILNEIRSNSKRAIALLRRDNFEESKKMIKSAENLFKLIGEEIKQNKALIRQGAYTEAVEEYIEAITFYNFLSGKKIKIPDFVEARPEEIISGICDFTGELVRKAVTLADTKNFKKLVFYKEEIENIVEELTKIGFQGKLRQKYDEAERNLKHIEHIIYDIKLKR